MSSRLGLVAAGGVLLGSVGIALVLLLAPRGDGEVEAPVPADPGVLEPAAADVCVDWILRALADCADQADGGSCTGRPMLSLELRVEQGQGTLAGLQLQGGEIEPRVWACLKEASRRFRSTFPQPRGKLQLQYPIGCRGDGRLQVLHPRPGTTSDPGGLPRLPGS